MMSDNAWEKLLKMLNAHSAQNAMSRVVNVLDVLHSFKQVVDSCFGMMKLDRFESDIKRLAYHYIKLINYCQQINKPKPNDISLHVTPKMHIIFSHISQSLQMMEDKELGHYGLGFYSEQAGERQIHSSHGHWSAGCGY